MTLALLLVLSGLASDVRVEVRGRLEHGEAPGEVAVRVRAGVRWFLPPLEEASPTGAVEGVLGSEPLLLTVDVPEATADAAGVWAEVVAPGWQRTVAFAPFASAKERLTVDLALARGGTVEGGVVDASGRGALARVQLVPATGDLRRPDLRLPPVPYTTDGGGRFRLHFGAAGLYHALALQAQGGTGCARNLRLDPARPSDPVVLTIDRGVALAGRVLDPDGVPVVPYALIAVPEGFEALVLDDEAFLGRDALQFPRASVAADGSFRFADLAPGPITLLGRFAGGPFLVHEPITLARPGLEDARVEARVHRLRVTVRDAAREVVVPARTSRREPAARWASALALVPDLPFDPDAPAPRPAERLKDDSWIRAGEAGERIRLVCVESDVPAVERVWTLPDSPWRVQETVELPPPVAPARLRLTIDGPQIGPGHTRRLLVATPSGVPVIDVWTRERSETLVLPPGAFLVRVTEGFVAGCGLALFHQLPAQPLPSAETEVSLRAGEERELTLALVPSAHLVLTLDLPRREPSFDIDSWWDWPDDWDVALGVRPVTLRPLDGGRIVHPRFRLGTEDPVALDGVAPGWPCRSRTPILPGRYALVVELEDGSRLETTVELASGETTAVTLAPR